MTDLWSVDELEACFVVRDEAGLKLAYVYFEEARPAISRRAAHQRRGTEDCGQYRQAAQFTAGRFGPRMACTMNGNTRKLDCEGIVNKRLGSMYRSGRSPHWVKVKNPKAPAVTREAEEDWARR